ncbi:MAG: hypothetical protein AVDCRST_MAG38-2938, partial [uncultured Solirubrobacteraceae bacterium]
GAVLRRARRRDRRDGLRRGPAGRTGAPARSDRIAARGAHAGRGDRRRLRRRARRLRGSRRVDDEREPALPPERRGDARRRRGALASARRAAGRGAVLLGVQRLAAGGAQPEHRRAVPRRPLLHLLRHPRGRGRGRRAAGVRLSPPAPAAGRRADLRDDARLRGARRRGERGHRRQLHVPARQAAARLAARPARPVAVVHPRRGGPGPGRPAGARRAGEAAAPHLRRGGARTGL